MLTTVLLAAVLSFFAIRLSAQTGRLFNSENHLSSSLVSDVYQDSHGYIWVATHNGLNRLDGYQIKNYHRGDGSGMSADYINNVCQDQKGNLFVATNKGVDFFSVW